MSGNHTRGRGKGRPHQGSGLSGDVSAASSGVLAASNAGRASEDTVPQEIKQKLVALLQKGPIQQAQLSHAWNEAYPGLPLAYKGWGFDRLKDALLEMPDAIRLERDPSGRDFFVSLAGTQEHDSAVSEAEMDKMALQTHVLLSNQKYAFTLDCLARDFAASLPGGLAPNHDGRKGQRQHHRRVLRHDSQVSV